MKTKCKIIMLPSEKSSLYLEEHKLRDNKTTMHIPIKPQPQHLYIISDEEIKEDNYYYNDLFDNISQLVKVGLVTNDIIQTLNENKHNHLIIATTDPTLNLPSIPKEFIQNYIDSHNSGNQIINNNQYEDKIHT